MKTTDYYKQEIAFLQERKSEYTDWGCTEDLLPIVRAINTAILALKNQLKKIEK